jgi:hypothetical protein
VYSRDQCVLPRSKGVDDDPHPFSTSIRLENRERNGADGLVKIAKKVARPESASKRHNLRIRRGDEMTTLRLQDPWLGAFASRF